MPGLTKSPRRGHAARRPPGATLRAAFEATGSTRWLMATIERHGLDARHGWRLQLELLGDRVCGGWQATEAALLDGRVDVIDTDWLSIARCRAGGLPICAAAPYGRIVGGLVVGRASGIGGLDQLRSRRVGVVRRLDKNWLLLRAACLGRHGFDPQAQAVVVEAGSKTELLASLRRGQVDAALLYWPLIPKLLATGDFEEILDLTDVLDELGAGGSPSSFFACREDLLADRPQLLRGFAAALADAVALLRDDADAWATAVGGAVRRDAPPQILRRLRQKWLQRVCGWHGGDRGDALQRVFETIVERCGADSVGFERMPAGIFMDDCLWRNP